MEAARHSGKSGFAAVLFRRTYPEITAPGGMWPESMTIYPHLAGKPNAGRMAWTFPSGAEIKFAHMQHETDVLSWLGAQIALIGFDQLETFEESQFWYMLSRNRSVCGVRPYIRATANPSPGWLADLLAWWINPDTGYPITERAGVLRWFARIADKLEWYDRPQDAPVGVAVKSLTFVPARLEDNRILMEADPSYDASLRALPHIEQERLRKGNWRISDIDGEWPRDYFEGIYFETWPENLLCKVVSLDPSKGKASRLGDDSAFVMLGVDPDGDLWADADMDNERPVEPLHGVAGGRSIVTDGITICQVFAPQAFVVEVNGFQELVARAFLRVAKEKGLHLPLFTINSTDNKQARIRTLGTYLAQRRLRVRNTPGGRRLVQQMREFPNAEHDDGPDALKMAEQMADYLLNGQGASDKKQPQALRA